MKKLVLVALAALLTLSGCRKSEPAPEARANDGPPSAGGAGSDVKPLVPGAGPITPVVGGTGMGGTTGGGAAQIAKDRARRSGNPAPGTQPEPEEGEGEGQ